MTNITVEQHIISRITMALDSTNYQMFTASEQEHAACCVSFYHKICFIMLYGVIFEELYNGKTLVWYAAYRMLLIHGI